MVHYAVGFCFWLNNILLLILTCQDIFRSRKKEGESSDEARWGGINVNAFHLPVPLGPVKMFLWLEPQEILRCSAANLSSSNSPAYFSNSGLIHLLLSRKHEFSRTQTCICDQLHHLSKPPSLLITGICNLLIQPLNRKASC